MIRNPNEIDQCIGEDQRQSDVVSSTPFIDVEPDEHHSSQTTAQDSSNQTGKADAELSKKLSGVKSLKSRQLSPSEDNIEVTFEVLLSQEMTSPNGVVGIAFGPPLSDWKTQMVEMRVKEGAPHLMPENYTPLIGVLSLPRDCQSKNIPYKYTVTKESGCVWEHIQIEKNEGKHVNRCLLVPSNIQNRFTKFDDVILADNKLRLFFDSVNLQRLGREAATNWMLPHPDEIDDPAFDFTAALEQFQLVVNTHGENGTSLCLGDDPKRKHNPSKYNVGDLVETYLNNYLKLLDTFLGQNDSAKLLRATLYLLLLFDQTKKEMTTKFCLKIFEAFRSCQDVLFYPIEQVVLSFCYNI